MSGHHFYNLAFSSTHMTKKASNSFNRTIKQWLTLTCMVLFFGIVLVSSSFKPFSQPNDVQEASMLAMPNSAPVMEDVDLAYGIPVAGMREVNAKIGHNELLADILLGYGIDYPTIHNMLNVSKDIFDVRRIRPGQKYCILATEDSVTKCRYFIYEKNAIDYVVLSFGDELKAYEGHKEVTVQTKTAAGVIQSSLYLTLSENDLSPALAVRLSEIYAWSIDFYRIQKGDYFKVIYEEKYAEGEYIGLGEIKAVQFNHGGEDFFGFAFDQNGRMSYYDQEGQSLRKAFLKAPLKFSRISSRFSPKRFHPVQKRWKAHLGTDYAAPTGTPIMTVGDGVVVEAKYSKYNGNYVKVRHNGTYTTQYLHMSKIAKGMKAGKAVRQGDVIGYVGSTGLATGPHVCFRFWKNGKQVDPFREKIPPSHPVDPASKGKFMAQVNKQKKALNKIALPTLQEDDVNHDQVLSSVN